MESQPEILEPPQPPEGTSTPPKSQPPQPQLPSPSSEPTEPTPPLIVQEINAKPLEPHDFCDSNPEFAVICSFIEKFGDKLELELDIEELKKTIEDQENLSENLIDIHVKLLKKVRRYFVKDQWEKGLIKFAQDYSHDDANQIETLGYLRTSPSIRLNLLSRLLDAQFECDPKFKNAVNLCEAEKLRNQASGRDNKGNTYWHFTDKHGNVRVYKEKPESDQKTLETICKNVHDLRRLVEDLDKTRERGPIKLRITKRKRKESSDEEYTSCPKPKPSRIRPDDEEEFKDALIQEPKPKPKDNNSNYDEEFACEDVETNDEPVILKRARTARKVVEYEDSDNSDAEEDKPCERCDKSDNPECILLCDMCDEGYHTTCCVPPLMYVPDGDWFCPHCEHKMLTDKLTAVLNSVAKILLAKEKELIRKQKMLEKRERLRQLEAKKEEARKKKLNGTNGSLPQKRLRSMDAAELIDMEDLDEESDIDDMAISDDSFQPPSATEDESDDDDLGDTETEVSTEITTEDESSIDEIVAIYHSKSCGGMKKKKKKKRSKKTMRTERKYFSESEDSDSGDVYSDDSSQPRRAAAKPICYQESSDEDDLEAAIKKVRKKEISSGDETDVSWKSHNPPFYEEDEIRAPTEGESNNKPEPW